MNNCRFTRLIPDLREQIPGFGMFRDNVWDERLKGDAGKAWPGYWLASEEMMILASQMLKEDYG